MVTQPTAGTLGNRGLRSHTELDGHGAYIPVPFTKAKRAQSVTDDETWVDGQVNPTLSLFDQGDTRATTVAVAHAFYSTGGTHGVNQQPEVSPAIKIGSGLGIPSPPAVAFQQNQIGEVRCGNIAGTVNTNSNASGRNTPMAMQAMTVRRLTPASANASRASPMTTRRSRGARSKPRTARMDRGTRRSGTAWP